MLESTLQKSVSVSLANGSMIEGFVLEIDEDYMKLVEFDNTKVIIRKSDVSYVKIYEGGGIPQTLRRAETAAEELDENQYTMPHQVIQRQAPPQQQQQAPQQQFFVVRGNKAQPQGDYTMENPNVGPTGGGPKFERQT